MADDYLGNVGQRIKAHIASQKADRKLSFVAIDQEQTNWCWAALTESVIKYFDVNSSWTQQNLATWAFKCDCSGSNGSSANCNQPFQFRLALRLVDRLARMDNLHPRFSAIENAIRADKPLCAQIAWNSGGAHVAAITGYRICADKTRYVQVQDTYYGEIEMPFDKFITDYVSGGTWTNTFYVK